MNIKKKDFFYFLRIIFYNSHNYLFQGICVEIDLNYHRLDIIVETSDSLPTHGGSMIRGAFGPALKRTVCINPAFECKGCFESSECLFFDFYEKQNSYHSYRFDVDLSPNRFEFSLYIFNNSASKLPYILAALEMMLTKIGLSAGRKRYDDFTIDCDGIRIYEKGRFYLDFIKLQKFSHTPLSDTFTLQFLTPLRMKDRNEFLKSAPSLEQILHSIHLRYEALSGRGRSPLGYEPSYHQTFARTRFLDLGRYSRRQETKLKIGGIVGEMGYSGVDERSCKLLRLGELIGVGKQTVFGMGKIALKESYESI